MSTGVAGFGSGDAPEVRARRRRYPPRSPPSLSSPTVRGHLSPSSFPYPARCRPPCKLDPPTTLNFQGVYLKTLCFFSCQLYVALSRVSSRQGLKILVADTGGRPSCLTKNIVSHHCIRSLRYMQNDKAKIKNVIEELNERIKEALKVTWPSNFSL